MNREILFRGKTNDGKWVFGNLLQDEKLDCYIREKTRDKNHGHLTYYVEKETVGQFTGLTDNNGKKIFEGDVVTDGVTKFKIVWSKGTFDFERIYGAYQFPYFGSNCGRTEVIGNINDNHELVSNK